MIALTLSVPEADWFTPWLKTVTTFSVPIQRSRKAARSAGARPVTAGSVACGGGEGGVEAGDVGGEVGRVDGAAAGDLGEEAR